MCGCDQIKTWIVNLSYPDGEGWCILAAWKPGDIQNIINNSSRYTGGKINYFKEIGLKDVNQNLIYDEGKITKE